MTLQYIRQARLQVGSPGNPGKIGITTPATPATPADDGAIARNIPADDPRLTEPHALSDSTTAYKNADGTYNLYDSTSSAKSTPGSAGTPAVTTGNAPATPGDGLDLSEMRFSFAVQHHVIQRAGSSIIRIWNLSDATATRVQREFTRVLLSAGYEGNLGTIFEGTVAFTRAGREGNNVDTYLEITAVEADQAHNFATVNTTLAAGSTPNDRLAALKKDLEPYGITGGYTPDLGGVPLPRGRVINGMVRDHLRDLAAETDHDWSIKGDQLNMIPIAGYLPGPAIVLNSRTGMVGLPEQTDQGIVFSCLLNPAIVPGRAVKIDQASVQQKHLSTNLGSQAQTRFGPSIARDGFYRLLLVEHDGDTRGENWYTTATCVKLADPIPKGVQLQPDQAPGEFYDAQRATASP